MKDGEPGVPWHDLRLGSSEAAIVEPMELEPMRERMVRWASINSCTGNLAGLQAMTGEFAAAFSALLGALAI